MCFPFCLSLYSVGLRTNSFRSLVCSQMGGAHPSTETSESPNCRWPVSGDELTLMNAGTDMETFYQEPETMFHYH